MTEITLFARDGSPVGVTVVDDEDADLAQFTWLRSKSGKEYAYRYEPKEGYGQTRVYLSRVILTRMLGNFPQGIECDHIDRISLNNRRNNLRPVTHYQNSLNRGGWFRKDAFKPSKYKGVRWEKRENKWSTRIVIHGVRKRGGYHENEEDAARAYDRLAREYHGEYAYLNFPT